MNFSDLVETVKTLPNEFSSDSSHHDSIEAYHNEHCQHDHDSHTGSETKNVINDNETIGSSVQEQGVIFGDRSRSDLMGLNDNNSSKKVQLKLFAVLRGQRSVS